MHSVFSGKGNNAANDEKVKIPEKLYTKVIELEDKCFKLNTDLETCESELLVFVNVYFKTKLISSKVRLQVTDEVLNNNEYGSKSLSSKIFFFVLLCDEPN